MSEAKSETNSQGSVKLDGLFAFKVGMASVFNDDGEFVPVTVLRFEPWVVSQIKTLEKDGYNALQIACRPQRASRATKAQQKHGAAAGFENGAKVTREVRQDIPEGAAVGQRVELSSLAKGDTVKVSAICKGRGFSGVVRRWSFAGGPASHGSGFHRKPGSVGNRTWPGRVMPGKRMAGHFGAEKKTVLNLQIVDVLPEENVVMVRGSIPGPRNGLVRLTKV